MESRFFLSEGPEGTPIWHEPPRCCFLIVKSTILYRQNHRALLFSEKPPKIHKNDPGMARPNTEGLPKVCPASAQRLPNVYRNSSAPQSTHNPLTLTARPPTPKVCPRSTATPSPPNPPTSRQPLLHGNSQPNVLFFREKKNCLQPFFFAR